MILVVTQTFAPAKGGMETYMTGVADHLARAGFEVVVLADNVRSSAAFDAEQNHYTLKRFGGFRPWRRFLKRRAVTALIASRKIEFIICDSWKSIESLPQALMLPVTALAHGSEYPPEPSLHKKKRITSALARAYLIIANSSFTAEKARAYLPKSNPVRLMIIHPPVTALPEPSLEALEKIRALLDGRGPVISTLARLEPRKGADRIIEALPKLIVRHPRVVFLIGGDGDDKERLQKLAQQCGVKDSVIFYGWVTDLDTKAAILSLSDVFAMPSYNVGTSVEGFGISYIEAAWFGVPSLGGLGSGAKDAVIDGQTGLLCDGNNQADVSTKLASLLDDPELRSKLGRAAQIRARGELSWEAMLPRFLDALELSKRKAA